MHFVVTTHLRLAVFKYLVATCGKWLLDWTAQMEYVRTDGRRSPEEEEKGRNFFPSLKDPHPSKTLSSLNFVIDDLLQITAEDNLRHS